MGQSIAAQILPFEFIYARMTPSECICPNPVRTKEVSKSVPELLLANGYQACPIHTNTLIKICDHHYVCFKLKEKTYYMPASEYQEGDLYEFDTGTQIILYDVPKIQEIKHAKTT